MVSFQSYFYGSSFNDINSCTIDEIEITQTSFNSNDSKSIKIYNLTQTTTICVGAFNLRIR